MAENEVLTRDKAIPEYVLPTGRKLGIVPVRGSGHYQIAYVDGKPGSLPEKYAGRYTGQARAKRDLELFLNDLWDISDKATKKKPLSDAVSR
jgi:hypothetical protein